MNNPQTHVTKKTAHKNKLILSGQANAPFSYVPGVSRQKRHSFPTVWRTKKLIAKLRFTKRLSPFLLTAVFLPVLLIYCFVAEDVSINKWLLGSSFVFAEVNLFYIDVALWKYYEGKKIFRVWLIELFFVLVGAFSLFRFF
jgi:hypothetical protein